MGRKFFLLGSIFIYSCFVFSADSICFIDKELNKDTKKNLQKFRNQTYSVCLECSGDSCSMKSWPTDKSGDAAVCKLLFCTPLHVSRVFEQPENAKPGKTLVKFDYSISTKGKIKGVNITSVKGNMNDRQAYKYVTSFTKKTSFEPLKIEGKQYQIINLSGSVIALIASPEEINKYREANPGVWRN